jgi:hypothetical protein
VIPIKIGENPPSARHLYGGALHDPKRGLIEPPSETSVQMVRFGRILKIQLRLSQASYPNHTRGKQHSTCPLKNNIF